MVLGVSCSICMPVSRSFHAPPSPRCFLRPGDPVDVPAAVPGAGAGFCPDSGTGPCLPPGCPVGSCQCCPGLWLFKTTLLFQHPWRANQEWQVRTEWGSISCCGGPSPGSTSHAVSLYPPQASSDGAVCTNLRAQLHRLWRGPREGQNHHWTQLLREKHIS